jgi:hypothetical protein
LYADVVVEPAPTAIPNSLVTYLLLDPSINKLRLGHLLQASILLVEKPVNPLELICVRANNIWALQADILPLHCFPASSKFNSRGIEETTNPPPRRTRPSKDSFLNDKRSKLVDDVVPVTDDISSHAFVDGFILNPWHVSKEHCWAHCSSVAVIVLEAVPISS